MDPGGRGKIQSIRGNVTRTPLHRIQGFQVPLETKFSGAPGQSNAFQRGLEKITIHILVDVVSLLSNGIVDVTGSCDSREATRVRETVAEWIVLRRTNDFGRLMVMNLTLHVTAVVWIRVVLILMEQRRQGIKMITHNSNIERYRTMLPLQFSRFDSRIWKQT
jgi:hypothetical protein